MKQLLHKLLTPEKQLRQLHYKLNYTTGLCWGYGPRQR